MERKKQRVMIVEDENILAYDLKRTLQEYDFNVSSISNNGDEAIKRAASEKPDLIIMDIMISGKLNGIDTAKIIRNKFNIPVIFLTALSDDETFLNAQDVSNYGYIIKPFTQQELKAVIEKAMAVNRRQFRFLRQ